MITGIDVCETLGVAVAIMASGYSLLAFWATIAGPRCVLSRAADDHPPPVTVIKPLCGAEPELEACLRSFCDQDYPVFQIVFGIQEADDPALHVVRRLFADYPRLAIDIVIDQRQWGVNRKVSNLINCMSAARYDVLVVADSDIRVGRSYLTRVCAPLRDARVGLVTCLYHGWAAPGLWSRLGALFIEDWFMPSVLVAHRLGNDTFASGATLALRRETLDGIGGFAAIVDRVADDYALGALIRAQGLSSVLSDYVVDTYVYSPRALELLAHETRWMRTIRSLQPMGYTMLFVTLTIPLTVLSLLLDWHQMLLVSLAGLTVATRVGLRILQNYRCRAPLWQSLWALPLRDLLTAGSWLVGLLVNRVSWRGRRYRVATDGSLRRTARRD